MNWEELARWSEVAGAAAFIIAMVVLFNKFLLPMVRAGEARSNADLVNAEHRREQLRTEVSKAREALEQSQREAQLIRERGRTDAERERDRIIEGARRDGVRALQNAQGELERARIAARDRVRIEFIEKALVRARALAGELVDDTVNARLVARTVDDATRGAGS